jgi:hypothetical protein
LRQNGSGYVSAGIGNARLDPTLDLSPSRSVIPVADEGFISDDDERDSGRLVFEPPGECDERCLLAAITIELEGLQTHARNARNKVLEEASCARAMWTGRSPEQVDIDNDARWSPRSMSKGLLLSNRKRLPMSQQEHDPE